MSPLAKQLEALLFVAGEAVSKAELQKLLGVSQSQFLEALAELSQRLGEHGLACVVTARDVELTTSPDVSDWLASTTGRETLELSRAAAETLAVVAYRGPLTRYEIDSIRGVDCRQVLRRLLHQGVVYRLAKRGRAPQYDISEEFLKHLGLSRREDLPAYRELLTNPALTTFFKQGS